MGDKLDARICLAAVLSHIANHVMDQGDVQASRLVSGRQKEFFSELSQEERDDGHRVIREPKGKCVLEPLATSLRDALFKLGGLGCSYEYL